jgi:hypothetical protein
MGKQVEQGIAIFIEQTPKGNFAVVETKDVEGINRAHKMPDLRDCDITIHSTFTAAQEDRTNRILNIIFHGKTTKKKTKVISNHQ